MVKKGYGNASFAGSKLITATFLHTNNNNRTLLLIIPTFSCPKKAETNKQITKKETPLYHSLDFSIT
jgi:hypothetical protein